MKSYIKKSLIIVGLGSLLAATSCGEDYLDETIYSVYTPASLTNKLGFEAALIGLYQQASVNYTQADQQGWLCVWQVGTDIAWPVQPQGIEVPFYQYSSLTPDNQAARQMWTLQYNIIENANSIINGVEGSIIADMTDAEKNIVNAEARFFRAWAYNTLATLYGGVPIVTEPMTGPKNDFTRATLDEVNALIEEDLTYATQNLPEPYTTPAKQQRANKYIAAHLFAEFYLRTGDAASAEAQCNTIINSNVYSLVTARYGTRTSQPGDPFSDMFWKGNQRRNQGNTEAIWVLENENPTDVRNGSSGSPQQRRVWGGAYHNRNGMVVADSLGGRGVARMRLNNWVLYDLYDDGDMRNSKHNIHRRFKYNNPLTPALFGQDVPYSGPDTLFIINPYTLKWKDFDSRDVFGYGMWKDFILMRLGETYLFKAEAQFKQGNLSGAAESINMLRSRANAPLVAAADITLDFILDERVRELLAEENRRMTLMRTGTLVQRANAHIGDNVIPQQYRIEGLAQKHLLFPIPLTEIQLNTGAVLEQNPGYGN